MDLSSLNIDIDIPLPAKVITCTIEGAVEPEDLARLVEARANVETPMGMQAGDIAKVREKHHAVARHIASGLTQRMTADLVGLTEQYLSTLVNAPSMQELIGYYRQQHGNAAQMVAERLKHVALKAVDKLEQDMDGDGLDANALLGLAKLGLDRSGHGPQSKSTVVAEQHLIDHAELARLNREARADSAAHIIEAAYEEVEASGDVNAFLAAKKLERGGE